MTDETNAKPAHMIHSESPVTGMDTFALHELTTAVAELRGQLKRVHERLDEFEIKMLTAQQEHTQVLRTVMVGWNAFLKSAEAQLRTLFKGSIPPPMLRKLVQMAFKGVEEMERKGK